MKIVVLVKEVPDTYGDRKLSLETGLADRGASETVMDEISERRYAGSESGQMRPSEIRAIAQANWSHSHLSSPTRPRRDERSLGA